MHTRTKTMQRDQTGSYASGQWRNWFEATAGRGSINKLTPARGHGGAG